MQRCRVENSLMALLWSDCPCFEDSIAILSAMLGSTLSHWYDSRYRPHFKHGFQAGFTPFGLTGSANVVAQTVFGAGKLVIGELRYLIRRSRTSPECCVACCRVHRDQRLVLMEDGHEAFPPFHPAHHLPCDLANLPLRPANETTLPSRDRL